MRTYVRLGLLLTVVLALAGGGTPAYAWSYPAALNTNAATDSGNDLEPQVATDGAGHWVAVWISTDTLGGTIGGDGDILVARSTDNGATWTDPAALNTNAATDSGGDSGPQVTTDGAGHWVAVWQSNDTLGGTIGTDMDILMARSTDNGVTWTDPAALNTDAATDSGNDNRPQVTSDGGGKWVAIWGSGDVLVARSTDNGATWTDPAALNNSGSSRFPQMTTDGAGNWVAVWQSYDSLGGTIGTDPDILVARSTDNGATWTDAAALNTNAATDSEHDEYPQVTTDGKGNWVAVWMSCVPASCSTDTDIQMAWSTDNGATWTDPAALNTNAGALNWYPQVTTDGWGSWVVVWTSRDSLGGTIGADWDILYATEFQAPPVGGLAELPDASDSAGPNYIVLAVLAAAALGAVGAGGWYARRRRVR